MLKQCLFTFLLVGLICAARPSAVAQDSGTNNQPSAPAGGPPERGHGGHFDPAQRAERLAKELKLTSDQQSKVQDILKSEQSQMEKLHQDSSLSQQDRHSKMMDIHKTSSDQIHALLTADQQKKWDELQVRQDQWMQGHHHPGGQAPAQGAPPDSSDQK